MQEQFNIFEETTQSGITVRMSDEATPSIQEFYHKAFGKLRLIVVDGKAEIIATDLAKVLSHQSAKDMLRALDEDEKGGRLIPTPGGNQLLSTVTEAGFYHAVLLRQSGRIKDKSIRETVKGVQRWVTHDVLPSINKHGGYIAGQETDPPEIVVAKALLVANSLIENQKKEIDALRPRAALADAVIVTKDEINVADLSLILQQVPGSAWAGGRNLLHKRLMADGYTRRNRNGNIVPSQKACKLGVLRVKESHRPASGGGVHVDFTTMVTGKGQRYFIERYAQVVS